MIQYRVDEKNRVVTARIVDSIDDIKENIVNIFMSNFNKILSSNEDNDDIKYINDTLRDNRRKNYDHLMRTAIMFLTTIIVTEDKKIFKGVARCMEEDEFVAETGMKIAKTKLINKINNYYSNKIRYLYYLLFLSCSNLEDYIAREEGDITADIEEYLDEENSSDDNNIEIGINDPESDENEEVIDNEETIDENSEEK